MSKKRSIRIQDLQGYARLMTEATIGITDLAEALHHRVIHPPFLPSTPIQNLISGVAGLAYQNVRWGSRLIGKGLDFSLGLLGETPDSVDSSEQREASLAALNGLIGDHLEESGNPLALKMTFRRGGKTIPLDAESISAAYEQWNGKILLLVHGSCNNDLQWEYQGHNHGEVLARAKGLTPIYLHYNSGRHISSNGQDLNLAMDQLIKHWPCAVQEIHILAHSMGGLVSRSALYYAQENKNRWLKKLKNIVFLGSPHHGAPLERAGNIVDHLLEAVPYAKPFARLGKIRSAGVTDLRYGNLLESDWIDQDRFDGHPDSRTPVPLPAKVNCYAIAANLKEKQKARKWGNQLIGDGLVPIESALGEHKDLQKTLGFKKSHKATIYQCHHMGLLSSPEVLAQLEKWLG